jgi:hypothetical protein
MAAIPMQFSMAEPARPPNNLDTNEAATTLAIAHNLPSSPSSPKVHILHSREFLLLPMFPIQSWKTPDCCFLIFQVELRIIPEAAGQKAEEWEMEWCPLLHQVQHSLLSTQS